MHLVTLECGASDIILYKYIFIYIILYYAQRMRASDHFSIDQLKENVDNIYSFGTVSDFRSFCRLGQDDIIS